MKHAGQPTLCAECEAKLHEAAEAIGTCSVVGKFCPHHRTLAVAQVEGGVITDWYHQAPVSDDQARTILAQELGEAAAVECTL